MHIFSGYGKVFPVIEMNKNFTSSLLLLIATVIWGSAFVSQSVAMKYVGPFTFQAIRCLLAFLILMPIIFLADVAGHKKGFLAGWKNKTLWKAGILCGIPLFLACNLQQLALVDTDAGKSGFLTAMYIIFVPLIGIFRKQKLSLFIPISVALAVAGLYLLSCVGVTSIQIGDLFLLGCAVIFAIQINVVDKFANQVDPLRLNALQILICTLLSSVCMVTMESPSADGITQCVPELMHVGFLSMGVSYGLQIIAQKNLPQAPAALIMSLESVFAALFGWLLLDEFMETHELIGCALLFSAVILSQIELKPKNKMA